MRRDPWTDDTYGDESLDTLLNGRHVASALVRALWSVVARCKGMLAKEIGR